MPAQCAMASVKQEATAPSSSSVGCGPVFVPPATVSGSSTFSSNSPAVTTARSPPSQRAETLRSDSAMCPLRYVPMTEDRMQHLCNRDAAR